MKRNQKETISYISVFFSMVMALLLTACGGGGSSAPAATGGGAAVTTISGKVTLSSTVAGKPGLYHYKSGSSNVMNGVFAAAGMRNAVSLSTATVELYNADHPEWLYPVATNITNTAGDYTLDKLCAFNDPVGIANNLNAQYGATYLCGDPIPAGNYTVIASKSGAGASGGQAVAVQSVVKLSSGTVTGNDLVAADSAAIPSVVSMFGLNKNTDGSFGGAATNLPANAAIQVTFSMAMARLSVLDAITIKDTSSTPVLGTWKISADLLSAMFVPTSALTSGTVYTVTVGGGTAAKTAKNVFGKAITATVLGSFTTATTDSLPPNAVKESPTTSSGVPIITPIRIAANEPLDVTTISVASSPSIGDKPNVIYIGKTGKYQDYYYVYEIVPATPLTVNTIYKLTVSGGKDLAGNALTPLTIDFATETTSAGVATVSGTVTVAVVDAQTAVKSVLGKWAQSMNDQNITALSSYMAGDFYWTNDPTKGGSPEDLNHDGRLDLLEFTNMLNNWFLQLKNCGSTVTLAIDTANTNTATLGGILVDPVTNTIANVAFTLTTTSTNTSSQCANGGNGVMYAEMQKINGAWIMTRGSEMPLAAVTVGLTKIATTSPVSGAQLAEPTATIPAAPIFKWTAGTWTNSAGTAVPFASYAVILVDNKSRGQDGWVGVIDGAALAAGSAASITFTPATGLSGSTLVLPSGSGFGFSNSIAGIKAGGDYTWAVLGFKTKTQNDFNLGLAIPLTDLGGSSPASNFTVGGIYKELKITVQDSVSKVYYTYNDWMQGFDAANSDSVILSITTPDATATAAMVNAGGYTQQQIPPATFVNGVATVTISLSNKQNWVQVCDNYVASTNGPGTCNGLSKQFNITTTGGALPKINITSVTGKTCAIPPVVSTTFTGPDSWNQYSSTDVCTVDIAGTVDPTITGTLNVQVGNNNNTGQYSGTATISGTGFSATGVPVFAGSNWVQIHDQMWTNSNQFGVTTTAGSTYSPPITGSLAGFTPKSTTLWDVTYDVGSAASVTATVNMAVSAAGCTMGPCSSWNQMDSGGNWIAGGQITASPFTGVINLYQGWNTIGLNDAAGNYLQVKIYTTGGTPYIPPNTVTAVSAGGVALTQVAGNYDALTNCSVIITGQTKNPGSVNVSLYNYNATTAASVSEFQTVAVTGTVAPYSYSITQNVYAGSNNISINDSMWNWQGVNVSSTCTVVPVVFAATVSGATYDNAMLYWNAGAASSVNISGTAGTGKIITASISSGMNYNTVTTLPVVGTAYSLTNVPIYNGYNYISVTDGANWTYLTVYTTGGAVYKPPFIINSVVTATGTTGTVTATDTTGYSFSGSASSITLSGTSTMDGTGTWYGGGTSGTFTVTGGVFNLTVALLNGTNYVDLYGPNGSWDGIYINTTGGTVPTKFVTVTSPLQNALAGGPTAVAVTATIDLTKGFTPVATNVWAYVYDYVTFQYTYYTSDAALITSCPTCGYLPLTYTATATTGTVSFNATVAAGNTTVIEVYAYDAGFVGHGDGIYVNNTLGYMGYSYKPGSNAALASNARAKANKASFLKKTRR